ncbi:unnamed protein product, partial [Polarella glacialis]
AIEALELKMPESFSRAKMRLRITCPESLAEEIRQYLQESASARIDVDELLAASSAARTASASSDAQIQEDASCTPAEGTGNGAEPVPTAGATVARSITFVCDPSHYRELDKLATVTHAGAGVQLQVLTAAVLEQAEPGVGTSNSDGLSFRVAGGGGASGAPTSGGYSTAPGAPVASAKAAGQPKKGLSCSACATEFEDAAEYRKHCRCDWHNFNLKRKVKGLASVSEEEYAEISLDQREGFRGE